MLIHQFFNLKLHFLSLYSLMLNELSLECINGNMRCNVFQTNNAGLKYNLNSILNI